MTSGMGGMSGTGVFQLQNIPYGKYRFDQYVSDVEGNVRIEPIVLYIDQIEWNVSQAGYDIGSLNPGVTGFGSGDIVITVKTIGAGFDLSLERTADLGTISGSTISVWDGTSGWGYEKLNGIYTDTLSSHGTKVVFASQTKSINTNGERNMYTYRVRWGAKTNTTAPAQNYMGHVSLGILLTY